MIFQGGVDVAVAADCRSRAAPHDDSCSIVSTAISMPRRAGPRRSPAAASRSSVACGICGRGRLPASSAACALLVQRLNAGQDGHLLVEPAARDLLPPGVEPLQVENRLGDQELRPRPLIFFASRRSLQLQRIGIGRGHAAEAERARALDAVFADQRAVLGQAGVRLEQLDRSTS